MFLGIVSCFNNSVSHFLYLSYCIPEGSIKWHGALTAVDFNIFNDLFHVSNLQLLIEILAFKFQSQTEVSLGAHTL
jgi:hypothetical protein